MFPRPTRKGSDRPGVGQKKLAEPHLRHAELTLPPDIGLYVPASQRRQAVSSTWPFSRLYEPAGHGLNASSTTVAPGLGQ